jgi:quinol monooxygenase YgiN
MKKYIVGWLTFMPGKRDEYFAWARPFIEASQAEEGCLFYEHSPHPYISDLVLVMECFKDEAAHAAHRKTPHFEATWKELNRLCDKGTFEDIFSDQVEPSSHKFGMP